MPIGTDYSCDIEFMKLLARRQDVDVVRAALELARDTYPNLEYDNVFRWIDDRVAELIAPVARAWSERGALGEVTRVLSDEWGLHGDEACFDSADGSYLHRVIETRRGIPISLSLLYMAIANRLGIELEGVAAPRKFLTRYDTPEGPLFLDAFAGDRVMTLKECSLWLQSAADVPPAQVRSHLKPATSRTIIIRMLNNLKALHVRQENWDAAWLAQHRLTALQPATYQERRDFAIITLKAQRPGQAIELLQSCLKTCPSNESEMLERQIDTAQAQLACWN
jgi:regulator of sirC expression with transglutaminase-like and TPR domain